jgi:hypothetical protein
MRLQVKSADNITRIAHFPLLALISTCNHLKTIRHYSAWDTISLHPTCSAKSRDDNGALKHWIPPSCGRLLGCIDGAPRQSSATRYGPHGRKTWKSHDIIYRKDTTTWLSYATNKQTYGSKLHSGNVTKFDQFHNGELATNGNGPQNKKRSEYIFSLSQRWSIHTQYSTNHTADNIPHIIIIIIIIIVVALSVCVCFCIFIHAHFVVNVDYHILYCFFFIIFVYFYLFVLTL